tara:strand:+ start:228 stop:554 length:327 start_codon:yes stop_codon:yes gene_type:complete
MRKLALTFALLAVSLIGYSQDNTFSAKLKNSNGGVFMVIIEDYGNYSYMTVNDVTLQIDDVKETESSIIFICRESDGNFTLELDFRTEVFRVYMDKKLTIKGDILYAG